MGDIERWQECSAMHHVGPDLDATVQWRDLGLMCDACSDAFGDTRPLQQQLRGAVEALREITHERHVNAHGEIESRPSAAAEIAIAAIDRLGGQQGRWSSRC